MIVVKSFLARLRLVDAAFLAVLLTATWIAYWPSLEHVPRADQWAYLIDTQNCQSLGELWAQSYSYNRVRAVGPGDEDLFRPVLFALLVLEKHFFGNHFMPSQALGLALHSALVVMFFGLLQRMARRGPNQESAAWRFLPHALTVFFALNFASMELVVWAHLHGYLLFLLFVLGAVWCLDDYIFHPHLKPRRARCLLAGCWLLALTASFTYELGQFFGVILGVVIGGVAWQRGGRRSALALAASFALVAVLYQGVNRWDRAVRRGTFAEEFLPELIVEKAVSLDTLEHTGRFLAFTMVQPFFPTVTGWWYQGERIHMQEPVYRPMKYLEPSAKLWLCYGVAALFFGWTVVAARRWRHGQGRNYWPLIAVPWSLFVLYAGITVLGRMNLRSSPFIIASNSYYTYLALLFFLIGAFALWQSLGVAATRWRRFSGAALALGLVFLGAYSSSRIWHVCDRLRGYYALFNQTINDMETFIAAHRDEPDFRLAFDMRADDPYPITHSMPFPLVLYLHWIDNHEPKYVISFPDGKMTATPAEEYRRAHGRAGQLFPDLVRVGTNFNLWRWQGKYHATLFWDDVYRPDLRCHAYVIEGDSIAEVEDEYPVRYEEFLEDMRTGWCIPPRFGTETLDEDYHGFELVRAGDWYYAIPASEGPFRVERFNGRRYSKALVADELTTLRRYVDEAADLIASPATAPETPPPQSPADRRP